MARVTWGARRFWVLGERGGGGESQQAPLALRAAHPHTVGYIGGSDREQGEIECRCRQRRFCIANADLRSVYVLGRWTT